MTVTRKIQRYPAGTMPQTFGAAGRDPETLEHLVGVLRETLAKCPLDPSGHATAYVVGTLAVFDTEQLTPEQVQAIHLKEVLDALDKADRTREQAGLSAEAVRQLLATLRRTEL